MSIFTLSEVPGYVDMPDAFLDAERLALAFPLQAQLGNAQFGMARTECFRYFLRDGDEVPIPTSPIDGYKYNRQELLYHWSFLTTADPDNDNRTSAPGNILLLDAKVEQWGEDNPGKVHCAVWYHMQGGSTSQTNDGMLTVTVIAQRGIGSIEINGLPTTAFDGVHPNDGDPDTAYTTSKAKALNRRSKHCIVSHEYFYVGEFNNGDLVNPQPVSPLDGYQYRQPQDLISLFYSWRSTADPCSGKAGHQDGSDACGKGGFWGTIRQFLFKYNRGTHLFQTEITYYRRTVFDSSTRLTNDGTVAIFAFCRRGTTVQGGAVMPAELTDQDPTEFMPCKSLVDEPYRRLGKNIRFAELRPEHVADTSSQTTAHGNVVPTGDTIYGQYINSDEKFFLWELWDSGRFDPLPDGALLQLRTFVNNDGIATIDTVYWEPDGKQSNVHTGQLIGAYLAFRGGHGDPPDPTDLGVSEGGGQTNITIYASILSADGVESATYVEADAAPLFLPEGAPDFTAIITLRANGAADAQRGASAKIQITNGSTTVESNVATIGDVDSGQDDLTVSDPPTGRVTIKLLLKKNNAGLWTGNVGATVKVPQVQGAG